MPTQVISNPTQPRPQQQQQQAARPQALTNPVISRHLDGVFGGDDDDNAQTIMIPSPRGESGVATPGKPRGNAPKVNDADLLNDLQQAIQDKFKELKD